MCGIITIAFCAIKAWTNFADYFRMSTHTVTEQTLA